MVICNPKIAPLVNLNGLSSADLIIYIKDNLNTMAYEALFKGLEQAITIVNQIIYRAAILSKETKTSFELTLEKAEKKAHNIVNNRRKRFVRRTWKKYPLFALSLIRERYTDYSEDLLVSDLYISTRGKKKSKFKKNISSMGLRISQIHKLNGQRKFSDIGEVEMNNICNKIAGYMNGLKHKTPILLTVNYSGEKRVYSFSWNETGHKIKTFISLTKLYKSFPDLDCAWSSRFSCGN